MRSITTRLTTMLGIAAVVGAALVHGQTPVPQNPPVQQPPPVQQTPPLPPPSVITANAPLAPPVAPCPEVPPGLADVGPMLDRIQAIVSGLEGSEARSVAVATTGNGEPKPMKVSGGTSNAVTIERDKLDEIRAELEQIKTILKK
jgi:hypothetical protein